MLPFDRLLTRGQLPPSVTNASLRVLFEDSLGFTRPFFCCSKLPQRLGSSHWILSKTASPSYLPVCPLPANRGLGLPLPKHVPSLSFFPTSTVCSTQSLTGLLHPATDHEVHLVSRRISDVAAEIRPSPQMLTPFEAFPFSTAALPITVDFSTSLRPLPSRYSLHRVPKNSISWQPQGFLHQKVRCSRPVLPPASRPLLPWASPQTLAFTGQPDCSACLSSPK
jgi:hypothetical protein